MNKKLLLLIVFNFFLLKAFSQNAQLNQSGLYQPSISISDSLKNLNKMLLCPQVYYINVGWYSGSIWYFDTIGIWSNYLPFVSTTGEENIFQVYSPCQTTYVLSWQWGGSSGYLRVAYKEHSPVCTSANWNYVYNYNVSAIYYSCELPLDSNKTYDIIVDYNMISTPVIGVATDFRFTVPEVQGVSFDSISPNSVRVNWTSPLNNIEIEYGLAGFTPGNGTKVYNANNHYVINNLNSFTGYDFYLKQNCGGYLSWPSSVHKVRTAKICDSSDFLYCDNKYITQGFDQFSYTAWTLGGCGGYGTNTEKIFQFIPDTNGIYNIKHIGYGSFTEHIYIFYKSASSGCNEKNWSCIASGLNSTTWNGSIGPLLIGQKYYISFYGSVVGSCCNNFLLTCPSPLCSQPPSGVNSNAINNSICIGESTSLSPIGSMLGTAGLYKWYKDSCSGAVISNTKIITVSPLSTTTYFLQITDSCGTHACDSITISVNQNPAPVLSLTKDTIICYNDSLPISVNQNAGDSVQWFKNNSAINAANDSTFYITDAGNYFATVFNSYGCYQSTDTINIIISKPNNQLNLSGTINLCNGYSITLSADSVTGYSYQWIKDGVNITGAVANNITVNDSGSYMVFIIDSIGCSIYSDSATVALLDTPQVVVISNQSVFCVGDSLLLSLNLSNSNSVQWLFNGTAIIGATDTIYYANQIGNYAVTVIDSSGCKRTSDSLSVLQSIPVADIIPANGAAICSGDSVQLSTTSIQGYNYQWIHDGIPFAGATGNVLNTIDSGYYYVSVIDTVGCAAQSDSVEVNLLLSPQVSIMPSGIIGFYYPSFLIIQATSDTANSFQWFKNSNPIPGAFSFSYTATTTGVYKVKVTDTAGCENYSQSLYLNSLSGLAIVDTNMQSKIADQLLSDSKLIAVTPNPANSITNVDLSLISGKQFDIALKNIAGQTIFVHKNYKSNNLMIDVSRLNKGVYIICLTGNINIFKKLIVN